MKEQISSKTGLPVALQMIVTALLFVFCVNACIVQATDLSFSDEAAKHTSYGSAEVR